jgi:hypothetical protein
VKRPRLQLVPARAEHDIKLTVKGADDPRARQALAELLADVLFAEWVEGLAPLPDDDRDS